MNTLLTPAWWCEFTATGTSGTCVRQTRTATTPTHAVIWMRTSLRTLVSGLAPADRETAYDWLDFGQWEAVAKLRAGETYTLRTSMNGMALAWHARRVAVLRLVPQNANAPTGRSYPA